MLQDIMTAVLVAAAVVFTLWKAVRFFSGKTKGCCSSCSGCPEDVQICCHYRQNSSEKKSRH